MPHEDGASPIALPRGAKSLLTWLLLNRGAPLTRESSAFRLWPDESEQAAFANLRRQIHVLTRKFSQVVADQKWILADHQSVAWNRAAPLDADLDDFQELCSRPEYGIRLAQLYRGELAADLEGEWLSGYRTQFREAFVEACVRSAQFFSTSGNATAAVKMLAASLQHDPWREDIVRAMILVRARSGDRAGALAQFESFTAGLFKEVGAHPTPALIATVEAIRHDRYDDPFDGKAIATEPLSKRAWLVPDAMRSRYFFGRGELLASVRLQLARRGRSALSGLGGVGKTQTALEYAKRYGEEYPSGVFWVNAESSSTLTTGFVQVAKALALPEAADDDHERLVRAALEWLNANDGWLLILDNAEDREVLRGFVPDGNVGNVLITSRERVFQEVGIPRALDVPDLAADESLHFLRLRTGREAVAGEEIAAAAELSAELGHLPLALEQAAAYIAETDATFCDYLSAFRKRRIEILERSSELVERSTVAVTWAANFAAVQASSPASGVILRVSAFMAPESIPFELVSEGADALGQPIAAVVAAHGDLAVAELLRPLARYSLVRSDPNSRTFGVHQLVQEMVRNAIPDAERSRYVSRAVSALNAALPEVEFSVWNRFDRLSPHVVAVAEWIDRSALSESSLRILNQTGRYRIERGRYSEARPLLERAISIAQELGRADGVEFATTLNSLALVAMRRGQYAEAQKFLERALIIGNQRLGPNDATVATTLTGLASLHLDHGQHADAEPLLRRALQIRERIIGPDARETVDSMHGLATAYLGLRRYGEAEALERRALRAIEQRVGPEDPRVVRSLVGLATVKLGQGDDEEARVLYERALVATERTTGSEHHRLAEIFQGLADIEVRHGRNALAQPLYERALEIRENALGDHPEVARALIELASFEEEQGNGRRAVELLARAQRKLEHLFGTASKEVDEVRRRIYELRKTNAADGSAASA